MGILLIVFLFGPATIGAVLGGCIGVSIRLISRRKGGRFGLFGVLAGGFLGFVVGCIVNRQIIGDILRYDPFHQAAARDLGADTPR